MAFLYFRGRVKFAVLEVGLGGRLDATNIVDQDVVRWITQHRRRSSGIPGRPIEAIAAEKAAYQTHGARWSPTLRRFTRHSRESRRPLHPGVNRRILSDTRICGPGSLTASAGKHRLAIAQPSFWAFRKTTLFAASTPHLAGRLETLGLSFSTAPQCACRRSLAAFLGEFYPGGVWIIFGVMADKQFEEMIDILKRMRINSSSRGPKAAARKIQSTFRSWFPLAWSLDRDRSDRLRTNHAPAESTILIVALYLIGKRA